jgi:RNA polymerase sigma-70 factor (ECF subfamily)
MFVSFWGALNVRHEQRRRGGEKGFARKKTSGQESFAAAGDVCGQFRGRLMHNIAQRLTALRPRLHRYAARTMGSAFDGEDVVQDAMAKLAVEDAGAINDLDAWMFRVTHTCALDALRRRRRQAARDARAERVEGDGDAADRRVAVAAGLATFLHLPPGPRSVVALADVLGHSIAETAAVLGMTEAAAKAALHRGRTRLRQIADDDAIPMRMSAAEKQRLDRYADRFNAHDWDALREMLAEDVRLDLVNRTRLSGAHEVSIYFTRYAAATDWLVESGLAEGRPALLFRPMSDPDAPPAFVVLLAWADGRIAAIQDFHYARYVMDGLDWRNCDRSHERLPT